MKLKIFDKIVLVLLILVAIALLGVLIYACWSPFFAQNVTSYILAVLVDSSSRFFVLNRIIITVVAALLIFLLLRILFVRKRDKREPEEIASAPAFDTDQLHIRTNDMGQSYITKDALLDMVQKGVRTNSSVRDSSASLSTDPQNGRVHVKLDVFPVADSNLPALSEELQKNVKENIEERTGILLDDVQVVFSSRPTQADVPMNQGQHGHTRNLR